MKPHLLFGILQSIMPAIQRSEFALALNQVANERGVDIDVVLDTVKNAILAAYRKDHTGIEIEEYEASLDPNTGEAHILHNGKDVTPPGFGRIAAQTAKQVILQKIREKEKEAILSDYRHKIGTVINGMVLRFAGPNIIIDIGKTEAIMPPQEQIVNEKYRLNQRLAVYLIEIKEGLRGEEIIVSRSSNQLLEGLFKKEVPEVAQGSVEIKAIVREPGNRSKVAVFSTQPGIDPVGSCVGQKGVRIQAIIQEFSGLEKIDIIQWTDDNKVYIANALSPAKDVTVEIHEDDKFAKVSVPQDQLSLTIGSGGQNVRLASKLTGYRIEVEGVGPSEEEKEAEKKALSAESKGEEAAPNAAGAQGSEGKSAEGNEDKKEDAVEEKVEVSEEVRVGEAASAESSVEPKEVTTEKLAEENSEEPKVASESEEEKPEEEAKPTIEPSEQGEEVVEVKTGEDQVEKVETETPENGKKSE